jgi:hypothetical protein
MRPEQEPKYEAVAEFYEEHAPGNGKTHSITGYLINRTSGEAIPPDEPVFVLRARDKRAVAALAFYRDQCLDANHRDIVQRRIHHFEDFAAHHPDRMKEPDSPA